MFNKLEKLLVHVYDRGRQRGWEFTDDDFRQLEKTLPKKLPEGRLIAPVIVPYLRGKVNKDKTVTTGVERTLQELWAHAIEQQDASWRWDGYDNAGPERLRLLEGIKHEPGLRLEMIDLGCQRDKKPMDVRHPKRSPHAGIFAAAGQHPKWIKAMDGEDVPYVWVPGYEVNFPDEEPWAGVPHLYFDSDNREIQLHCSWCGGYDSGWAVPSFFRE